MFTDVIISVRCLFLVVEADEQAGDTLVISDGDGSKTDKASQDKTNAGQTDGQTQKPTDHPNALVGEEPTSSSPHPKAAPVGKKKRPRCPSLLRNLGSLGSC